MHLCQSKMYQAVIVQVPKERSFGFFPFIIPKKSGEKPRLIIDYGHLRTRRLYSVPKFQLRPILASAPACSTLAIARFFAKIDIKEAFYSPPLPKALWRVSTFKFGNKFYQFRRLPMGLFISPYLLQTAMRALLKGVPNSWVHIDDILLWGKSQAELRDRVILFLRRLYQEQLRVNLQKSKLEPQRTIDYCGLRFEASSPWNFTEDKVRTLHKVLFTWDKHREKRTRRYLGFVTYVLFSLGLSSAWAKLINKARG